jgi:hypothetical protein
MKYIDNAGKPAEITYRKMSDACSAELTEGSDLRLCGRR